MSAAGAARVRRGESWLWAGVAGLLLAQAYLTHGAFAWAGVLALGVALERAGEPAPVRLVAGTIALVHGLVGLSAWGFVHHGVSVYLGQALYLTLAGGLVGALATAGGRGPVSAPRLAVAWTAVAWVREQGPLAFPLLLGGTQAPLPTRGGLAVVGAIGLGGLLVGAGLAVVRAVLRRHAWPALAWLAGLVLACAAGSLGAWTEGVGAPIEVRIVQGSVPSWLYTAADASRVGRTLVHERYYELSAAAVGGAAVGADERRLVVLPETALKVFTEVEAGRSLAPLFRARAVAGAARARVVTGTYRDEPGRHGDESTRTYNSVAVLPGDDPRAVLAFVDKRQLAPLTEDWLEAGEGDGLLPVWDVQLGVLVCFESMFSRLARGEAPAAGVLVIVTNDAAFESSPPAYTHAVQGWARAVEAGRPLVRAAQSGLSLVVDERGGLLGELGSFEDGLLEARVQPRTGATPFVAVGYLLGPVSATASLIGLVVLLVRRRRATRTARTSA